MVTDSDEYLLEKCSYQFVLDNEELEHNEMLRSISDKLARYEKALLFIANENILAPPAMVANTLREIARKALEGK